MVLDEDFNIFCTLNDGVYLVPGNLPAQWFDLDAKFINAVAMPCNEACWLNLILTGEH